MAEFARAMRTTYLFSIILVFVGAVLVLAVSGSIRRKVPGLETAKDGDGD
jgi:uncharacterized membrane protein YeaQ/YmgE (transglycosylase-associated protein family)